MSSDTFDGRVVVAVHGDRPSEDAVRWGVAEARLHDHGLTLVHVVTPLLIDEQNPELRQRIHRWRDHRARQMLNDVKHEIASRSGSGLDDVKLLLRFGSPVAELTEVSKTAEMLVVGSRFHGSIGGRRLGSVSAALSYRAHCPIAVVHQYDETRSRKPVLVGIDGSPASEAAIEIAFGEASRRGVGVIALHAWSDVGVVPLLGMEWHEYREKASEVLAERLAGWQEDYPDVQIDRRVCCDVPAHALQAEARRASLVVVGSRGRGATATLILGSVATAVAEGADAPVIITRDN